MNTPPASRTGSLRDDVARLTMPNSRLRARQGFLDGQFSLMRGRVHEFCGPARAQLAAFVLQATSGTVVWASPAWLPERIYPYGLLPFADPNRILFVRCRRPEDILWAMEEALRSGGAPLVLADMPKPPALTPIRRLHLAAEAGGETGLARGRPAPLGLILTPQMGGAPGVESRWHCRSAPGAMTMADKGGNTAPAWVLMRLRARDGGLGRWDLRRDHGTITATPLPDTDDQTTNTP